MKSNYLLVFLLLINISCKRADKKPTITTEERIARYKDKQRQRNLSIKNALSNRIFEQAKAGLCDADFVEEILGKAEDLKLESTYAKELLEKCPLDQDGLEDSIKALKIYLPTLSKFATPVKNLTNRQSKIILQLLQNSAVVENRALINKVLKSKEISGENYDKWLHLCSALNTEQLNLFTNKFPHRPLTAAQCALQSPGLTFEHLQSFDQKIFEAFAEEVEGVQNLILLVVYRGRQLSYPKWKKFHKNLDYKEVVENICKRYVNHTLFNCFF
jgi:hypothetical protein